MQFASVHESRALLLDLSEEFFNEASNITETIQRQRQLESVKRRAVLRLVRAPILGYEHQYHQAIQAEVNELDQSRSW